MLKFIILLLFSYCAAFGQNASLPVNGTYAPGIFHQRNFVKNPGAEQNANYLTQSTGITTRSTSSPLQGVANFLIDGTASAQTVKFDTQTLDGILKGQNCEARFTFSGDATLYKTYVEQGSTKVTTDLQLTNETNSRDVSINFACGDLSSNSHLVIETTNSAAAAIKVDNVYLGQATNVSSQLPQAQLLGSVTISACNSTFDITSTTVTSATTATGCTYTTSGLASAPGTNLPAMTISSVPAGEIMLVAQGLFLESAASKDGRLKFYDGTGYAREQSTFGSSAVNIEIPSINQSFNYTSAKTNVTFEIQGFVSSGGTLSIYGVTSFPLVIRAYWFPSQSQVALAPSKPILPTIQKFLSGSGTYTTPPGASHITVEMIGGGGGGAGSGTGSGAPTDGGNTTFGSSLLTANGGVQGATDGAGGGAGGSATLNAPAIGKALSGGYGATQAGTASGGGGNGCASPFGGEGGGTQASLARAASANTGSGGGGAGINANSKNGSGGGCGGYIFATILNPSSSYSYSVGSAGTAGTAGTSGFNGGNGAAGIIVVTEYYQNVYAPVLVGSVTSSLSGPARSEGAKILNPSGTASIGSQTGDWVASVVRNSTGNITVNFKSGYYSVAPFCTVTPQDNADRVYINGAITTSAVVVDTRNGGGTDSDSTFYIMCMGAR